MLIGQVCGFPGSVANCSQHGTTEYVALTCTGDLQKTNNYEESKCNIRTYLCFK